MTGSRPTWWISSSGRRRRPERGSLGTRGRRARPSFPSPCSGRLIDRGKQVAARSDQGMGAGSPHVHPRPKQARTVHHAPLPLLRSNRQIPGRRSTTMVPRSRPDGVLTRPRRIAAVGSRWAALIAPLPRSRFWHEVRVYRGALATDRFPAPASSPVRCLLCRGQLRCHPAILHAFALQLGLRRLQPVPYVSGLNP